MDNYNNIMDNEYGNIVYGGTVNNNSTQMSNIIPEQMQQQSSTPSTIIIQHQAQQQQPQHPGIIIGQHNADIKDISYPQRESIITTNIVTPINVIYTTHTAAVIAEPQHQVVVEVAEHDEEQDEEMVETQHIQHVVILENHDESIENMHGSEHATVLVESQDSSTPTIIYETIGPIETDTLATDDLIEDESELNHDLSADKMEEELPEDENDDDVDLNKTPVKEELEADEENVKDEMKQEEESQDVNEGEEGDDNDVPVDSVKKVKAKKEIKIDPDQCRVCMSTENLLDIFKLDVDSLRFCDMVMLICSTIRISERDYLPHLICSSCIDKVKIAYEFKTTCENTDKELRKNLKRSKNKERGQTEFVMIDCEEFSDESEEEDIRKDDDEFRLSESISELDSDDSFELNSSKRKKPSRPRRRAAPRKRSSTSRNNKSSTKRARLSESDSRSKSSLIKRDIIYIEANNGSSEDEEDDNDKSFHNSNSRRRTGGHSCPECGRVCATPSSLREHVKTHSDEKPFACHICDRTFKLKKNLTAHVKRHLDQSIVECPKCNLNFTSRNDLKQHITHEHEHHTNTNTSTSPTHYCNKCTKTFSRKSHLDRHKAICKGIPAKATTSSTPSSSSRNKRNDHQDVSMLSGRDLFKCVAPTTTTYWSDSFSE